MTVASTGPTSAIRRKKSRNATAVQTTPSTATAASTAEEGIVAGSWAILTGAYKSAQAPSETATTSRLGRSARRREMISGPKAYPNTTSVISRMAVMSPLRSSPTSATTPAQTETGESSRTEPLMGAGQAGEERADEWDRGHEQP